MRRRALLRRIAGASALTAVGTASAHPGDEGSSGTDTDPTGTGSGPHARIALDNAREAVVGPSGTIVYVAAMDGFVTVDIADPHDPTILAEVEEILPDREEGPLEQIYDVKIEGDRLLVVGPAHPSNELKAAVLYDVADPANPEMIGAHETGYSLHNAYLQDGVAYLCGNGAPGNPMVTVDISSDDGEFTELGRWSLFDYDSAWEEVSPNLRTLHDLWVHDDLVYLAYWDAGTWILDVSDPADPTFLSRVRGRDPPELPEEPRSAIVRESTIPPGNDHYVTTNEDGTLLGIDGESWAFEESGGPSGITFYDVSDPENPVEQAAIEPPESENPSRAGVWTTAHNFQLVDGYCYSSWYQGGVKIHDVSDPAEPVEEYHWRESDAARFWTAELAVEGQSFIAPSMGVPSDDGETPSGDEEGAPALYVFPDVVHEGPDETPTQSDEASGALGPGFGVGAAIAGALGAGALWARKQDSDR